MKRIFITLLTIISVLIPLNNVYAYNNFNLGINNQEKHLIEEEKAGKKNIISNLEYRFLEKEDKDVVDYLIFIGLWVALIITISYINKKTYIVKHDKVEDVFVKEKKEEERKEEVIQEKKKKTTTKKESTKKSTKEKTTKKEKR